VRDRHVWNNDSQRPRPASFQAPCHMIGMIIQLPDGLLYFASKGLTDWDRAGDDMGDCPHRHARQVRDILDCRHSYQLNCLPLSTSTSVSSGDVGHSCLAARTSAQSLARVCSCDGGLLSFGHLIRFKRPSSAEEFPVVAFGFCLTGSGAGYMLSPLLGC